MDVTKLNDWEIINLGDAATFINGYAFKPTDWSSNGLEIIRIQNLTKGSSDINYFSGEIGDRYKVKYGDLLISWSATLGIYLWKGEDAWLNQHLFKVVFDKKEFDKQFFKYLIGTSLNEMGRETHGSTMKHITKVKFDRFKIPYPPLPEQQKIASILDAADNLRQKDQQLIEKYTALSQSLFLEMFGDPVSNPMGWDKRNLQDLVKSVIDCPHTTPNWTSSGKVAIRTSNLTQGGWSWKDKRFVSEEDFHDRSKRGYVKHGDIILSREGTVGVLAIVEMEMEICLGQRLVQLIPDFSLANNYYLLHLLLYELEPERISRIMVGATSKHLNVKELREMSLPVPPIDLQNQFAERIQSIEAQKQLALASLEKSEALFNTLLQRAFKGELTT